MKGFKQLILRVAVPAFLFFAVYFLNSIFRYALIYDFMGVSTYLFYVFLLFVVIVVLIVCAFTKRYLISIVVLVGFTLSSIQEVNLNSIDLVRISLQSKANIKAVEEWGGDSFYQVVGDILLIRSSKNPPNEWRIVLKESDYKYLLEERCSIKARRINDEFVVLMGER